MTENILYSPCQREEACKKQTLQATSLPTAPHTYTDTHAKSMGCRMKVSPLQRTHKLLQKHPHQPVHNLPTITACIILYTPTILIRLCFSKQVQLPMPLSKLFPPIEVSFTCFLTCQTPVHCGDSQPSGAGLNLCVSTSLYAFLLQQVPVPLAGTSDTMNSKLLKGKAGCPCL